MACYTFSEFKENIEVTPLRDRQKESPLKCHALHLVAG